MTKQNSFVDELISTFANDPVLLAAGAKAELDGAILLGIDDTKARAQHEELVANLTAEQLQRYKARTGAS